MKVVTPDRIIKELRKRFKITQSELAGNGISRSTIAMIESGKNKLNENNAKILAENFNSIFRERDIKERISMEEILKDTDAQREKLFRKTHNKLMSINTFEEGIKDTEINLIFFTSKEKSQLFKMIGDSLRIKSEDDRALSYYLRSVTELIIEEKFKDLGDAVKQMTRIYLNMADSKRFMNLENIIKYHLNKFDKMDRMVICFNLGTLYSQNRVPERAIGYFEEVGEMITDHNSLRYFDLQNELAICYIDILELEKAEKIYRSLMRRFPDTGSRLGIYGNMVYLKLSTIPKDMDGVMYYVNKCRQLLKEDPEYIYEDRKAYFYESAELYIGLVAKEIGKEKLAKEFLSRMVDEKTTKNLSRKIHGIIALLEILKKKDLDLVLKLEELYFKLIDRTLNKTYMLRLATDFSGYYMRFKLHDEHRNLCRKIQESVILPPKFV